MNDLLEITIRHYTHSAKSGRLFLGMSYDPRACSGGDENGNDKDGCHVTAQGHTPKTDHGGDLDIIVAAGMARHWATGLIRLKFGLDPTTYRPALRQFQRLAMDTGTRLKWDDPELTAFLAEEALHGWLLDRQFHGNDADWRNRCVTLRKLLNRELHDAAVAIQHCL